MRIRDHNQSADVFDLEAMSIAHYLAENKNPASEEYTQAVDNLEKLQKIKESEVRMKNESKSNLIPGFAVALLTSAVTTFGVMYMFEAEARGDTILNQSTKGWVKSLPKAKFKG